MTNMKYRGLTIEILQMDAPNAKTIYDWTVKNTDGFTIAKCEHDECEYKVDAAVSAAKEAIDEFLDN